MKDEILKEAKKYHINLYKIEKKNFIYDGILLGECLDIINNIINNFGNRALDFMVVKDDFDSYVINQKIQKSEKELLKDIAKAKRKKKYY